VTTLDVAALYSRHRRDVLEYLIRHGCPRDAADDLVQDIFIRALRARYADQGKPLAWLYTIARNRLTDYWKSSHTQRSFVADVAGWEQLPGDPVRPHLMAPPEAVEELAERSELLDLVRPVLAEAIGQLSGQFQQALRMRYWEGLDQAEAAELLGTSVNAVKARHYRAMLALRQLESVQRLRKAVAA